MDKFILFILLLIFSAGSSHAQALRSAKSIGKIRSATTASRKIMQSIQQDSYRAEKALREAARAAREAATNSFKPKPTGIPFGIPSIDTDEQDRKKSKKPGVKYHSILLDIPKPNFPTVKSFMELKDELIAKEYETIKQDVKNGQYDFWTSKLFEYADYAMRHNDEQFAITCLEHGRTDLLTPEYLMYLTQKYPALNQYFPEISRSVAFSAYSKMVRAKLQGTDCDSARMHNGDTLLIVTKQYNPALNPLVMLSCFYDPSKETELYKETADSVIATYEQWSDSFKNTFAYDFALTLMRNGEYATVLDYFGREPLKHLPNTQASLALNMASCAAAIQNDSLFSSYFEHALALDPAPANDYWANYYNEVWNQFIADPSQTELADWLLENASMPANDGLVMSWELIDRYLSNPDANWEWADISAYTPEQVTVRQAIFHILDKGLSIDEGRSEPIISPLCKCLNAEMLMVDPSMVADARTMFDCLTTVDLPELRCRAIIGQANIAAHGLDKPKEALKILKKNIKLLDDPAVNADMRDMWYDYMAALASRLGKTKDAEKYRKLKNCCLL